MAGPSDILVQAAADAMLDAWRARTRQKEAEQARAHERETADLAHSHRIAETAAEGEWRERAAQRDFARDWEAEEHAAGVRIWEQVAIHSELKRREVSPFRLPENDIRVIAEAATRHGQVPALLIAPFLDQTGTAAGMDVGRQIWWRAQQRADWVAGLAGLAGHMRAISDLDVDLSLIRMVLGELPFVLIHGDIEADQVVVRVVGSGMLPRPGASSPGRAGDGTATALSICGTLPWPDAAGPLRVAADAMDTLVACAGALGEVFHLATSRALPRLHQRVPGWLRPAVTAMIVGGYGLAVENSPWDPVVLRGLQELVATLPPDDGAGVRRRAEALLNTAMSRVAARGLLEG